MKLDTRYVIIFLGLWMIAQPLTFGTSLAVSDTVSGVLLLLLGGYAILNSSQWILWAICLVGVWLQFAPLVFWAPDSASYINDVLIGVMAIACSILFPVNSESSGSIPGGWSYNPSAPLQRLPIVFFGFLAWMFARYMTAYQLGYLDHIADPLFGDGTEKVITSSISKKFPVPDAGLGAMAYTLEVLMACHGGARRWHTTPWFVVLFAILVIPVGFASIVLIILQPIIVHAWCTWCLLTAVCMLIMIAFAVDEVAAVWQFLRDSKKAGKPLWEIFWKGGSAPGASEEVPPLSFSAMRRGISVPWNLVLTALIGLWLMFSPHILGIFGSAADSAHIVGALVAALSVISMAEVARSGRFIILLLGLFVLLSAWIFSGAMANSLISGLLLVLLSIPKGRILEKYGDFERYIR